MLFDLTFAAEVHRVAISVKEKDGVIRRICKLTLAREFDSMIATGMRGKAKQTLLALEEKELESAVLPIGAIVADCTLKVFDQQVVIGRIHGVQAKAKAGKEEDDPPSIRLEFEFEYTDAAWVFLGRHCMAYAEITMTEAQGRLALGGDEHRTEA